MKIKEFQVKIFSIKIFLILLSFSVYSEEKLLSNFNDFLWKNRIVLIWSKNPLLYKDILDESKKKFQDRDMYWFMFNESKILTNYIGKISEEFVLNAMKKRSNHKSNVVLIGKDGGVKNSDKNLNLGFLFDRVDSMPMRVNEMRFKKSNN